MAEPSGDVLVGGDEREPGELWRRVPVRAWVGLAVLASVAAGLVALATGTGRPEPAPPAELGTLGPASVGVDESGLLVRVEAELRAREPVVLRSGTVTGTELVLLLDPVRLPAPGAPGGVRSRIVGLVEPRCGEQAPQDRAPAVLQIVIAPQAGGEAVTLGSPLSAQALASAREAACAPVRASVALVPGSGPAAEQLEVTVRLVDASVPVDVLALTGRGLRVGVGTTTLGAQVAAATAQRTAATVTAPVVVTDCSVEVLAQRGLELEVQRGDERLSVQVDRGPGVVAALDELVRRTCRRPRG